MAYTALERMRKRLAREFGSDVGPRQPALADGARDGFDLKSAALRLIHVRCEGLRFDADIEEAEERTGELQGTSRALGQIPYNMQMDINRLCLERELERFIDSGATRDAYNVFYCFVEIFLKGQGDSRAMVDLLGECESSVSTLLMEHRDHYSHSVYVFALGLAIFETNATFRRAFCRRKRRRARRGRSLHLLPERGPDGRDRARRAGVPRAAVREALCHRPRASGP